MEGSSSTLLADEDILPAQLPNHDSGTHMPAGGDGQHQHHQEDELDDGDSALGDDSWV